LGNEWRQYENIFPLLAKSKIDQISLECRNSKVPIDLIKLLKGKDVLVGSIDVATKEIETPEQVYQTLKKASQFVETKNLYACTNCGMVNLPKYIAYEKMKSLVSGSKLLSKELGII